MLAALLQFEPTESLFTSKEVAELTGTNVFTLAYWANAGIVKPVIDTGGKQGKGRLWNVQQLKLIAAIRFFREAGLPMRHAKQAAGAILEESGNVQMLHNASSNV